MPLASDRGEGAGSTRRGPQACLTPPSSSTALLLAFSAGAAPCAELVQSVVRLNSRTFALGNLSDHEQDHQTEQAEHIEQFHGWHCASCGRRPRGFASPSRKNVLS